MAAVNESSVYPHGRSESEYLDLCCRRFSALTWKGAADRKVVDVLSEVVAVPTVSPPCSPSRPSTSPKYEIIRRIGSGASSNVFLARRLTSTRGTDCCADEQEALFVAVKVVDFDNCRDPDMRARCCTEVACLSSCSCFAVLRNHAQYHYPSSCTEISRVVALAIVLDLADAGDLRAEIKRRRKQSKPFREEEIGMMLLQVTLGLRYLHTHGIVHRDVKTSNILLCSNGIIKIADFGLSKLLPESEMDRFDSYADGSVTVESSVFCGTPMYMAPEMWLRQPYGVKVDMFSLGVVLYEMLTLERLFGDEDVAVIRNRIVTSDVCSANLPPLLTQASPEMISILCQLLQRDPAKRIDAEALLRVPLMRLYASALLEMVVQGECGLAAADKGRVLRGIRKLAYHAAPRKTKSSSSLRSQPLSKNTSFSVSGHTSCVEVPAPPDIHSTPTSFSPVMSAACAWPAQVSLLHSPRTVIERSPQRSAPRPYLVNIPEDVAPMFQGPLQKQSANGEWKERFVSLAWEPHQSRASSQHSLHAGEHKDVESNSSDAKFESTDSKDVGSPLRAPSGCSAAGSLRRCVLVIAKPPDDAASSPAGPHVYPPHISCWLEDFMDVFPMPATQPGEHALALVREADGRKLVLRAKTQADCESWIHAIEMAMTGAPMELA